MKKEFIFCVLLFLLTACTPPECSKVMRGDKLDDVIVKFGPPSQKRVQYNEVWYDFDAKKDYQIHVQVSTRTNEVLCLWCGNEDVPRWGIQESKSPNTSFQRTGHTAARR